MGGLRETLLKEINDQLNHQQLYIKTGENTQDSEAAYNVKTSSDSKQKTTYGYKAHITVEEDGFIKTSAFTAGNVHDSQCLAPLLSGQNPQYMQTAPLPLRAPGTMPYWQKSERRTAF